MALNGQTVLPRGNCSSFFLATLMPLMPGQVIRRRLPPTDIVLLAAEWQPRALIRAQLIEEGFEVVATNSWPMMRRHLRPGMKPRLVLVDLKGLPDPASILNDLRVMMKPGRVLVLTAVG